MTNMNDRNMNGTNNNGTNNENKKFRMNKTAITAVALAAVLGVGSIGGLALSKYLRTNKTATETTYGASDDTTETLTAIGAISSASSAAEAEQAAEAAEKAAAKATEERIAAEKAAAKASASEKAAAQKLAEQKAAAEKEAKKKAEEAKKAAEEAKKKAEEEKKKKEEEKKKVVVNWSADFFYATGNTVKVNHYTNGKLISVEGVEYKDNGNGTLTGTDGTLLFSTEGAARAYSEEQYKKANQVDWSAEFFYATGDTVKVNHYTTGFMFSEDGVEYKDNGDGTLTGSDGTTLFSTKEAADAYSQEQYKKANQVDWSATYFTATGNEVKVNHYTTGFMFSEDGVEYKDNGDGTLTGTDGTILFNAKEAADAYAEEQKAAEDQAQKEAEEQEAQEKAIEEQRVADEEKEAEEQKAADEEAAKEKEAEEQAQKEAEQKAADQKAAVKNAVAKAMADGELTDDEIANISSIAGGVSFTADEISAMGITSAQAQSMGITVNA